MRAVLLWRGPRISEPLPSRVVCGGDVHGWNSSADCLVAKLSNHLLLIFFGVQRQSASSTHPSMIARQSGPSASGAAAAAYYPCGNRDAQRVCTLLSHSRWNGVAVSFTSSKHALVAKSINLPAVLWALSFVSASGCGHVADVDGLWPNA